MERCFAKITVAVWFTTCVVMAQLTAGETENWPAFRGGKARAVVEDDQRLPMTWSTTDNVVWKAPVEGLGWSSPIVWDDLIFLTTVASEGETVEPRMGLYFPFGTPRSDPGLPEPKDGERMEQSADVHSWLVYAFDINTGAVVWKTEVHQGAPGFDRHLKNSYASETPVTDGDRIYAYFGNVGVFALDMRGSVVWERRVEISDTRMGWGTASSPVIFEDQVFVVNDNDDQSYVVALDAATGDENWRVNRDEGTNWATPFVWENQLRTELVTVGTGEVRSYGLDGSLLWSFKGLNSITIPQPFSEHGMLYVTSGYVGDAIKPVFAIRPGASGDITLADGQNSNEYIVWYDDTAGPYHPTPLVYGDYYFTLLDRGFFTVHDALTGEELYFTEQQIQNNEVRRRVARGASGFTASPWAYNGKIFVMSEDGDTYVLDTADNFRLVSTNSLDEVAMSSPAIVRGSLFIRTRSHLWRLSNISR